MSDYEYDNDYEIDYDPDAFIVNEYDDDNGINFTDLFLQAKGDINLYQELISLEKDNSTNCQWSYQSYEQICLIYINEKNIDDLKLSIEKLFDLYHKVDDCYRENTTRIICSQLNNLKDNEYCIDGMKYLLELLKEKEITREVTNAGINYARKLLELNYINELGEVIIANIVIDDLLNYMIILDDSNEIYKTTKLELLVMKIQYCNYKKMDKDCRSVYYEALELNKEMIIEEYKLSAIIYEEGGKINLRQKNFEKALENFKNSFSNYQKSGEISKSKMIMKYEILCCMISRSKTSLFSREEAKPYMDDLGLLSLVDLHEAFEQMNITNINNIWNERILKYENDEFILENLNEILHNIRFNYICQKLNAYKICKFETLEKVYCFKEGIRY
jgi:hypothetical protein